MGSQTNCGQMDRRLAAVIMATPSFASADMPTIKDKRTSSPCNLLILESSKRHSSKDEGQERQATDS